MKTLRTLLSVTACFGLVISGGGLLPAVAQQPAGQSALAELPDSPGAVIARLQAPSPGAEPSPQTPAVTSGSQTSSSSAQSQSEQAPADRPQQTEKPVGTAVAGAPNARGVAAAQPSGVAIAPAKQRRVRTIVLRMGAIAGAGIAIGSVVALTQATPSKPPGAH